MHHFSFALVAVLVAVPGAVFAQRPLVTDDADMLETGNCHIESYVKRQRRINETETWLLPACNAFGSLEMTVGGYRISPSPDGSTTGVFLQGKTVFRKATADNWGAALSFGAEGVRTSTASSIGRKNGWNPFLNLIVSGPLAGEALALRGNVAYVRDTLEKENLLFWGVAVEFPVTARVRGFVETFQITHEKPTQHLGMLVWAIPERLWIDGTVGFQTMSRADGTSVRGRFFTIGLKYFFTL